MRKSATSDQEVEELLFGDLMIIQARDGYRYSIDPFLLASFSRLPVGAQVIDLGSGSGVIPLVLSKKDGLAKLVGLELQEMMVERSRRSVVLNRLQERIEIMHGDVRNLPAALAAGSFDAVLTNPPYRTGDSGRISRGEERSRARHELAGGLADFLRAASVLLKRGGSFFIIYLAERMPELMVEMRHSRIEPKRMRMVCSRVGEDARLVLVEGCKEGKPGLKIESPLIIYKGAGRDYTDEVLVMYGLNGTSDLERGT